jgi:hypothetical protein
VEEATKRLNKWGGQEGTTLKNWNKFCNPFPYLIRKRKEREREREREREKQVLEPDRSWFVQPDEQRLTKIIY